MPDRFWDKVSILSLYSCWEWQAACRGFGYGAFWFNGRHVPAHRRAYELTFGVVSEKLKVRHLCDNPPCVNPLHLKPGTQQENVQDCIAAGRRNNPSGVDHWNARLSDEDVAAIRRVKGTQRQIATEFGINQSTVWKIKHNLRRKN